MTLRARLALFIALAIVLAVLSQQVLGGFVMQTSTRGAVAAPLERYLGVLSAQAPARLGGMWRGGVEAHFEGYQTQARLVRGTQVLAEIGGGFPACLRPLRPQAQLCDPWWVASRPLAGGLRVDAAILALNSAEVFQRYQQTLLFGSIVLAILGAGCAWLLAARTLAPLSSLTRTALAVSESGDLGVRVPQTGSRELTTLAGAFNRMLERLAAFRWREAEFTRHASHELRTPLTAMRLELTSYRAGYASAEDVIPSLEREVARMTRLTEALLLLAREAPIARAPLDLAALARELAAQAGVSYLGEQRLVIPGHAELIARVVENLLENAARHAPGAAVQLRIQRLPDAALLVVSDAGPGMRGGTTGHGFGLGVVERVMGAHGGELRLSSVQPQGLCAALRFPLAGGGTAAVEDAPPTLADVDG